MGGCSSKPKTAEYEGILEVQEDKPSAEVPRKSVEAEVVGLKVIGREQELSAPLNRNLVFEEEDDVQDLFAETHDKRMIAASSPEGEERQVLEDDSRHVKQILAETMDSSQAEKGVAFKEVLKPKVNPEIVALELHKDPVSYMKVTDIIQEAPLCAAIEAGTAGTEKGSLALPKESSDDSGKAAFPESESPSLKGTCISTVQDLSKLPAETTGLHNGLPEVSENLLAGGKDILKMQKEPSLPVGFARQEDLSTEASDETQGRGLVGLKCCEAVSKTEEKRFEGSDNRFSEGSEECGEMCEKTESRPCEEQRLDASISHKGEGNQSNEGCKECGELSKETEGQACEEVSAASNAVLDQESGEDVLKEFSRPGCKDELTGCASDEVVEKVTTNTCMTKDGLFQDTFNQEPTQSNVSPDVVHSAIITDVRANDMQHVGDELDLVQEEQEVNGKRTCKAAMKGMELQAEDHLINGFMVKESNAGTLQASHGDGELPSSECTMNDNQPLPLTVQLPLEKSLGEVQGEMPYAAEGQAKAHASCAPDGFTTFLVNTSTKMPEAEPVHVLGSAELGLSSTQDTPAPDIDDVLEKLASEFERQESLARIAS